MSKIRLNELKLFEHFSIFAYPFIHNIKNKEHIERLPKISDNWETWWSRIESDENLAYTLDSTYFFLPYIRNLIFPETNLLKDAAGEKYSNWINQIKILRKKPIAEISNVLPERSILRLTLKTDTLSKFQNFNFADKNGNEIEVYTLWIDLILFPTEVGFLLFKTKLSEKSLSLNNLTTMNQTFRNVHPFNIDQVLPVFNFQGENQNKLSLQQIIEILLDGFVPKDQKYTESEEGQVYGEKCHLFSFAGINLKELNLKNIECGEFDSIEKLLLYEFATCTNLYDSINKSEAKPSKAQIEKINSDNLISSWECWNGLALRESVVFLANEQNNFNKTTLPFIIEDDYLPLYLYTLYQKYQLYLFSNKLMQKGADINKNSS